MDNQRDNLRPATRSQNLANRAVGKIWRGIEKTTPWRGVSIQGKRFTAQISVNSRKLHLGCFVNKETAASYYDAAARIIFGDFAVLNFPRVMKELSKELLEKIETYK